MLHEQKRLAFLEWEFGLFFHFGIRSFYPGHRDWDGKEMPLSAFNPAQLDCAQWLHEAKAAGAKYTILVTKHHDGFALWPSKHTDYSVAHTPWKNGKGDIVREYMTASRAAGLKTGLYYSPAQWGGAVPFKNGRDYDDYFIRQISELLTGYGKLDYLWFDGCGSDGHQYDRERIVREIRSLQPDILIFGMWDPDVLWIGNEDGYAPLDNPCMKSPEWVAEHTVRSSPSASDCFLPSECDCKIRDTWFTADANENTLKTPEELLGMYEMSVGRGSNMLLNIGPDRRGLLPEADTARLHTFAELVRQRYGSPLDGFSISQVSPVCWSLTLSDENGPPRLVNRIRLMEDMTDGGHISSFRLSAHMPGGRHDPLIVYEGKTVGHKRLCSFPAVRTSRLTLEVEGADTPALRDFSAFFTP